MRPTGAEEKNKSILMLTRYNYMSWREDIEDRCRLKNRKEEEIKIAFLRQGLNMTQKNQLRTAMMAELTKKSEFRTKYDGADPESKPYTWAMGYIREKIVRYGLEKKKVLVEARKIEQEMAAMSIADFGYNLQRYYNRFHSAVERMVTMGYSIMPEVLVMYFQDGCRAHRSLELMTLNEDTDEETYGDLFEKYHLAIEKMERTRGRTAQKHTRGDNNGRARATKFKGNCHHCGKSGHKVNTCWIKNPELTPDWAKKDKDSTSERS